MSQWSIDEVSQVLIKINEEWRYPHCNIFDEYTLVMENGRPKLIGKGGFSFIFEAKERYGDSDARYAMKVVGFGDQNVKGSILFGEGELQKKLYNSPAKNRILRLIKTQHLLVLFDDNGDYLEISEWVVPEKRKTNNWLELEFYLMEKAEPIIKRKMDGSYSFTPEELGKGDEIELLKMARDISNALMIAHYSRIIHRDVKPENIFYDKTTNTYKLGDFGVSKRTSTGFANTIAMTRGYSSPEVVFASDESQYDHRVDIYSLGMTIFAIANRMHLVPVEVQYKKGFVLPQPMGKISKAFYQVLAKACMFNPDERYQNMDSMIRDLDMILPKVGLEKCETTGYEEFYKEYLDMILSKEFMEVDMCMIKLFEQNTHLLDPFKKEETPKEYIRQYIENEKNDQFDKVYKEFSFFFTMVRNMDRSYVFSGIPYDKREVIRQSFEESIRAKQDECLNQIKEFFEKVEEAFNWYFV